MQADQAACRGFTGMINLSLTDLIQMVCLSRSDIVIRVKSDTADGVICIKKGQVQHAETNTLQGEGAFLEILRWKDGQFEIQSPDSVLSNSIDKPWEHLLLEAMRQHDEHLDGDEKVSGEPEHGSSQPTGIPLLGAENVTTRVDIGEDPGNEAETTQPFPDGSLQPQASPCRRVRVLVVDDSTFFARQLSKMLETDEDIQVVGTAKNGREAVDFLNSNPGVDVITLDIQMPVMQGDTTLKHIMIRHAIPVLIVSALDPKQINKVFEFLQLGALDFVPKPVLHEDIHRYGERLRFLVKGAASADIGSFKRCRKGDQESISLPGPPTASGEKALMIVGAEGAHMEWLRLPWERLCHQGLVVGLQKIAKPMLQGFAELIENFTGMTTVPIDDQAMITPGRFYLSDAGRHVELSLCHEPSYSLVIEESLSEPLSWENGRALWMEKLSAALGSRLSVCFLSGVYPLGDDSLNTLVSHGSRLILPSASTIVCRKMIESIKRYSENHSCSYMSGSYDKLTEVWK